jgi:hypothetical protein
VRQVRDIYNGIYIPLEHCVKNPSAVQVFGTVLKNIFSVFVKIFSIITNKSKKLKLTDVMKSYPESRYTFLCSTLLFADKSFEFSKKQFKVKKKIFY